MNELAFHAQTSEFPERFASKVVASPAGCWLWQGWCDRDGHGGYKVNGHCVFAHRYAWECLVGVIPDGMVLRHTCDNPACVNPAHLLLGSHADNVRDRVERGRNAVGERNGRAKLTAERVARIIDDLLGGRTAEEVAAEHGVCESAVRRIGTGRTWHHVTI